MKILRLILKKLLRFTLWFLLISAGITLLLRWLPIPITGIIIERQVGAVITGKSIPFKKDWVSLDKISPNLALAVIAAEDQKFLDHHGFDWKSIDSAVKHNAHSKRTRGASTLSQQTAKNVFLWSGRSWLRKGLETWFTVLIETLWSKQRIMEVYLNSVEFGTGIYGAEAASQYFFRKTAKQLSQREAALLAAVLPNPHKYNAKNPGSWVLSRQQWIVQQMNHLGGTAFVKSIF
jgi:monofunctional biosynthetic peptidoglycan transglycosylase